jgi:hypothetical protein
MQAAMLASSTSALTFSDYGRFHAFFPSVLPSWAELFRLSSWRYAILCPGGIRGGTSCGTGSYSGASYVVFGETFTAAVARRDTPAETLNGSGDLTLSIFDVLDQSDEPNSLPPDAGDGDAVSRGSGATTGAGGGAGRGAACRPAKALL